MPEEQMVLFQIQEITQAENIDELLAMMPEGEPYQSAWKCWYTIRDHEKIMCSVSGGWDSDIMLDLIIRCVGKEKTTFCFFDTGLEYDATKQHIEYLEERYGIEIKVLKPKKAIPTCCKEYGVPFWSKFASEMIHRLQRNGFQWEDEPFEVLLERYPKCRVVLSMLGDEGQTPTLKDHFPEVRKMMPIALDQLKAMNEKVVFVQIVKKDFSSVCDLKSQHVIVKPSEGRIKLFNGRSVFFSSYGAWLAYAYPPAHIDREAWTAEWKECDDGIVIFHCCSKCGRDAISYTDRDDDFKEELSDFCPSCGRAMTQDAWAELEKRMGLA